MIEVEHVLWKDIEQSVPTNSDLQGLARHLKEYANTEAYQDEKVEMLKQATEIESYAVFPSKTQEQIEDTEYKLNEAETKVREHLDKMLSGIETLLDTDIETLFSEDFSEEKVCE